MLTRSKVRRFASLCEASGVNLSTGMALGTLRGLQSPDVRDVGALFYGRDTINRLKAGLPAPFNLIGDKVQ